MDNRPSWDTLYMSMAYLMSYRSPDRSTKTGAVITTEDHVHIASGYNGLPRGVEDDDMYHIKPQKYFYFEHAERNALYNAGRIGARLDLAHTLYITWIPCADCARAIIQTGIEKVVVHKAGQDAYYDSQGSAGKWGDSQNATDHMFKEAGVRVHWYTGPILGQLEGYYSKTRYVFPGDDRFERIPE